MKSTAEKFNPVRERIEQDIFDLSLLRDADRPGWTREVFSEHYREARQWTRQRMIDAGMEVHTDGAGNIVGRLPGLNPSAPALVTGSHTDTVDGGGRFDGIVGVLGAIEAVRQFKSTGTQLNRDLLVVDFLGEESNPFGLSCLGSRALAGELSAEDLLRTNHEGLALGRAYESFGLDPSETLKTNWARNGRIHSYLELHVEQGGELEKANVPIGIVTAITGIERLVATFIGQPDHAGTRPMAERHDAMIAAANAVLAVRVEGCGAPSHGVATTTHLRNQTHSPNVVPSLVKMLSEVRSVDPTWLSGVRRRLANQIQETALGLGVDVSLDWSTDNVIVKTDESIQDVAAKAASAHGIPWIPVPSGATHDAVHMARLAPMGMIFVPSKEGKSHCPEEWTDFDDLVTGVRVLGTALIAADAQPR